MTDKRDSIRIIHHHDSKSVQGTFSSLTFLNEGFYVAYIPSLKLSSYGKTIIEADNMLVNVVLKDFCEQLTQLPYNAIITELKALGFKQIGFFRDELCKTAHIDFTSFQGQRLVANAALMQAGVLS